LGGGVLTLLPPPPHPASPRVSNNPAASGTSVDRHRLTPGCFRRPMAHAIAARTKASINRARRPGERGRAGGRGRERGALTEGAVVVTLTVTLVPELPAVTGVGTVQVASEGAPVQVRLTLWLNPPSPAIVKVYVADCPGATVSEVEEPEAAAKVKSWPVPLSAIVWGLLGALSLNERLPDAVPAAVGVNVTAIVQVAAAATGFEVEQVVPEVAMAKGKVTAMALKVRLLLPVLVRVTVWELLVVPTN
jgi:hypothetical protein